MEWAGAQDPTIPAPAEATRPAEAPTPGTFAPSFLLCPHCDRVYPGAGRDPTQPAPCPICGGALRPVQAGPPIDPPAARPHPADGVPFGRYLLRRELGRGGMGVVHEAWDTQLNRAVALKMLTARGGLLDDKAAVRLLREARSAARLHHPGIVAIHDVGESEGRPYFTMDLVEGRPLEECLRGDPSWASFPLRRRVEVLAQVAEALGYAHAQGVVHRDVKPSNVMVDSRGRAMLMDFGLAKELSATDLGQDLTVSGAVLGTPRYMSPEQAGGGRDLVGPRSDVFSFGIVLYHALTGRLPFEGEGLEAILAVLSQDPAPPSRANERVHRDLETITMRCLEKVPARRFADGAELAAELRRWIDGEPILSRPVGWVERVLRKASKRRAVLIPAAIAVVLAGGLWYALHDRGAQARLAEQADADRRAAEGRERRQAEALTLVEQARAAYAQVQPTFYDKEASVADLLARVETAQGWIGKAIDLCPDLAPAHYLMGVGWEVRGWDDRAEASYRRALSIDPRFGPAHYRLARICLERAFLATLGASRPEMNWSSPGAQRWAKLAAEEAQAALADGGGFDDDVQRQFARAMAAYTGGDHVAAAKLCEEGLRAYARSAGREDLYWLRGLSRTGLGPDDSFDQAIAIRPKFALALFCRALTKHLAGDKGAALADYDEAIRVSPRFATAYANRGNVKLDRADQAGALADYEAALSIDPRHAVAFVNRGYVRSLRKDHDGAIADFTAAIESNPGCVDAYANRADSWREKGDLGKALADCETALRLDPRSVKGLVNRGCVRVERNELEGALADFEAAIVLDPRDAVALAGRARIHVERGELKRALADYDRAIECDPEFGPARYNRGSVWLKLGDHARARADFTAAIERDPSIFDAWYNRGALRAREGDFDGALSDLDEAARLRPSSAMALASRGGVKSMKGDIAGARADLDEAIRVDPSWVEAWRNRAIVRSQAGDAPGALADCDEAVKRAPEDLEVRVTRGTLRAGAGDNDGAKSDLDAVLAKDPRNAVALIWRGNAKAALNDLRGALADYEAACEAAPDSPEANADRGMALLALGDREGARKSLEKALEVAPAGWAFRGEVEKSLAELRRGR